MSDHHEAHPNPPHRFQRRWSSSRRRFFPFAIFFFFFILLFIGGTAAILYLIFSEYSGVRNIWLLLCGAPFVVIFLLIVTIFSLYTRFGKPLGEIFNAIDAVAEGNLSVRVPEDNSPQFQELIKRFNKMVSELERADQQRRNLTSDIAHELRTPLHIIQGNLEGIVDGVYEPTTEHINNTLDETKLLARLVNDLQTLSLAEAGQLPLHPTRFLLADLMHDLTASFSAQATSLGIDLTAGVTSPNQEITADYDRLNQVLSNLISNALRHTPKGGTISLKTESGVGEARSVRITVKDSGEGIASEDIPFIFDRFWRGDKSRTGRVHSGLGLAIAKQIVLAHGGTIEAESDIGKGTTFTIELPTGHA
ncbi:HAMP domain-containing sensor histidine kinase [Candidatus Villigracilis affinis]|uniref:sensor histidine kinase n=1 Tax=Candidatus Villigracilis affinis TaxID=3140682 RepID=UPI001B403CFE|nr:HAMP domain-containing histidine kinase [Anaerolineales bacterium]MBL0345108.1 HAMP domain-containing histidine kinase [Anaerolineales bacterium]MBP8047358.1 HAMP domain-containing histidine kinase [Anaerolineales bacterium]